MIVALLFLAIQTPPPATATLVVEGSVAVSSASPIRMKDGGIDGPVVIDVVGDARRAYRLQVQTTVTETSGETHVVSDAGGEVGLDGTTQTGADGRDRVRIFGATALLRLGIGGGSVLPLRIVYE
jgi:hypothetical protein